MPENKPVPLMLSIPKAYRDQLRKMAAEQNLKNQDQVTSASTLARQIICGYLEGIYPELASIKPEESKQFKQNQTKGGRDE